MEDGGSQLFPLTWSTAAIPRLIIQLWHRWCYCNTSSDIIGGMLIWHPLFCEIWSWIHHIRGCHSSKWDTVNTLPTNTPIISLPHIYRHRTHCWSYWLPLSYAIISIIPPLFCSPHSTASLLHICCFCINHPTYPPYLLMSVSLVPVVLHVWLLYTYQPASPLTFSPATISITLHLYLHHPCFPTSRLCLWCHHIHHIASLPLLSLSSYVSPKSRVCSTRCDTFAVSATPLHSDIQDTVTDYVIPRFISRADWLFFNPFSSIDGYHRFLSSPYHVSTNTILICHPYHPMPLPLPSSSSYFYTISILPDLYFHYSNHPGFLLLSSPSFFISVSFVLVFGHLHLWPHKTPSTSLSLSDISLILILYFCCHHLAASLFKSSSNVLVVPLLRLFCGSFYLLCL